MKESTSDELKAIVKEKYAAIAGQDKAYNAASCCGATDASNKVYNIMMDDYSEVSGYAAEADLGLGCGLPTAFAQIKPGDTVLDLGSGAGNDCFVARHETGAEGKVIGVDFTEEMIKRARINTDQLGFNNVEFRQGDIEDLPLGENSVDVVISNCVLNLVPNKDQVISEIFRVLKPGGHFSISDVVLVGGLPEALKKDAELYAGCVSGAIQKEDYLSLITEKGFADVSLQKEKTITLPEDILQKYLSAEEVQEFNHGGTGIYSITVFAKKPGVHVNKPKKSLGELGCSPESGCC